MKKLFLISISFLFCFSLSFSNETFSDQDQSKVPKLLSQNVLPDSSETSTPLDTFMIDENSGSFITLPEIQESFPLLTFGLLGVWEIVVRRKKTKRDWSLLNAIGKIIDKIIPNRGKASFDDKYKESDEVEFRSRKTRKQRRS